MSAAKDTKSKPKGEDEKMEVEGGGEASTTTEEKKPVDKDALTFESKVFGFERFCFQS